MLVSVLRIKFLASFRRFLTNFHVRSQAIPISCSAPSFFFCFVSQLQRLPFLKGFSWLPFSSSPNLRNEFIPKCYFSRSIVFSQPRFHIEGQVKLVLFGERVPGDWRRAGARRSWRTRKKNKRMRCFLLYSWWGVGRNLTAHAYDLDNNSNLLLLLSDGKILDRRPLPATIFVRALWQLSVIFPWSQNK